MQGAKAFAKSSTHGDTLRFTSQHDFVVKQRIMISTHYSHKVIAVCITAITTLSAYSQRMQNFDEGWSYVYGGKEHHVTLPHAWNEDYAFRVLINDLPTDTVRYVKDFTLPSVKDKKVFIEFEGVRQSAKVWLNGHYLGMHENGITAFGFDLTPYLNHKGTNHIEVLTDNSWNYVEESTGVSFQWNNKNFNANYGGITKHVYLHVLDKVYQTLPLYSSLGTEGVYIYAKDIDIEKRTATLVVEAEVKNDSGLSQSLSLTADVYDNQGHFKRRGNSVAEVVGSGKTVKIRTMIALDDLKFWSWGFGYLYTVKTYIYNKGKWNDEVSTNIGIRKTEYGNGLFTLNDRVLMVHGYAQRTSNEWPGVGMSVPSWLSDYSNGLMVESGGNLVRWMHTMPWKQDIESCDRVGLLQAMPAGDAEKDVEGRQWEQRIEVMRDAIVYNRNNPSIIFYECGNENISDEHMAEMIQIRDAFDPHGGRAIGSREMLSSKNAEYGGEMLYINKSGGKPVWAMEYCRDEGLRRYWDDWSWPYHKSGDGPLYRHSPAEAYNHNQDQLAIEHIRRWYDYWEVRPGTGRRVSSGGVKIVFSDTNTHCRGESNYRTSGVTDAMRLPKDSYFVHQVMWDGWVEPESSHTYIMGHWNYEEGVVKPIYVVSAAPKVELLVNGKSMGISTESQYRYLHTFDSIAFEPGRLQTVSYDADGNKLSDYTLFTVGDADFLEMSVMTAPEGFKADGADMALVTFEALDCEGRRNPLDHRNVRFELEGPAEWRGGIGKGEGNCVLSKVLPLECGVNRALIRSTHESGTIRLTAYADGLDPVSIEWESVNPADAVCKSERTFLRGETPSTPSYQDTKHSIAVKSIIAGCNQDKANNSIDDNEDSEWTNDGKSNTAWISYELEEPSIVNEISIKLTGWRRRSYPLQIYADNELVWDGSTPMSLGYVSLPLMTSKPASKITIRLKGAASENEAFGQIVELAAPVGNELDLYKAEGGDRVKSELRIIEIDFLKNVD